MANAQSGSSEGRILISPSVSRVSDGVHSVTALVKGPTPISVAVYREVGIGEASHLRALVTGVSLSIYPRVDEHDFRRVQLVALYDLAMHMSTPVDSDEEIECILTALARVALTFGGTIEQLLARPPTAGRRIR